MHYVHRIGWLRAAVLGANDGIVSVASVLVGVAAAGSPHNTVILSGLAALVAGAMSMAAGEYVSVSSQADTEPAVLAREKSELETHWDDELEELTTIYERRGLDPQLAHQVARQLMEKDALGAQTGGASLWKGAARVAFWGALALAVTYAVGALFGTITG
jgi:VIT1/CCC1 family predicted Fe2+/Mn2+ transporter